MPQPVQDRRPVPTEALVEMARLKGLSDGVVAFALTLLVLDIRIPEGVGAADLPASLVALAPSAAVYLIAFAIIGGAWGSHQRMLGQIGRGDGLLVWYTLLSLLPITLMPAVASTLGDYPSQPVALGIFASDVLAIQVTAVLLWRHAGRHELISAELDQRIVHGIGRRLVLIGLGFAVSIPLAWLLPALAYALWVAVFALVFTTDWLSWQDATRTVRTAIPLDGVSHAQIHVRHSAGRLQVDVTDDDATLLEGVFGGGLNQQVAIMDGNADIRMAARRRTGFLSPRYPWAWGRIAALDWDVGISGRVSVALAVDVTDGEGRLELGDLRLTELEVRATAAALEVSLPASNGVLRVAVHAKAAKVDVRVPAGAVAAISCEPSVRGMVEVDPERFPMVVPDRLYRSPQFETAAARVEIDAHTDVGSVAIH